MMREGSRRGQEERDERRKEERWDISSGLQSLALFSCCVWDPIRFSKVHFWGIHALPLVGLYYVGLCL